jgi:hypothetical protein
VRIPWLTRVYERTCDDCGYVWLVPKDFAHPHMHGRPLYGARDADRAGEAAAANAELAERAAAFRRCARCESGQYKERSIRS